MNAPIDIEQLVPAWERFRKATAIAPIREEAQYERMTEILWALLDCTKGDEDHPAMELVDIVGDLIEDYEAEHFSLPEATGLQALSFLMEQHGLHEPDLPDIGSASEVAAILSGQQEMKLNQVRALSRRFGVSPATFV